MTVGRISFGAHRAPLQKKITPAFANGGVDGVPNTTGAPTRHRFVCENSERDPDEAERDEMTARERFVIKKDAEEERTGRREILQEAECCESKITCRVAEPEERDRSDDAGADKQDRQ